MAAVSLTVIDVTHNADGTKTIIYGDSTSEQLAPTQLNGRAEDAESKATLKADIAAYWKARSSDYGSSTPIVGKTFQKDLSRELGQLIIGEV